MGITSVTKKLSKSTTEDELIKIIDDLNKDESVDGILVQLPLPDHINERNVRNTFCYLVTRDLSRIL